MDAFELWCWRRLLRVPWTARRSNQSILKEISPGCSLEGLMLKLKLQYFGHLMRRVDSLEKTPWCWGRLKAGGEGHDRGWEGCMASPTQCTWVWVDSGSWWWTGRPAVLWFMGSQKSQTRLSDWTELNWTEEYEKNELSSNYTHLNNNMIFTESLFIQFEEINILLLSLFSFTHFLHFFITWNFRSRLLLKLFS